MTRVILWPASYGCPATVVLERDGVTDPAVSFDGGGNVYWANRHANDFAHELACEHAAEVTPGEKVAA